MLDMYVTEAPTGVQFDADSKRLTTSINAILATSTTAVDEQRMVAVLQRALTKPRVRAERLEQLQASMQGNLGPTDLVYHLWKVGILENDDDLDETSFLEQRFSEDVFKPNATPLQHDPWWFKSDMDEQYNFSVPGWAEQHNNSAVLQSVHVKLSEQQKHADVEQLSSMLVQGRRLAGELKSMGEAPQTSPCDGSHRNNCDHIRHFCYESWTQVQPRWPCWLHCRRWGGHTQNLPSVVTGRFWILFSSVLAFRRSFMGRSYGSRA